MTQIFPLSEGTFTIGHDKVFQIFNRDNEELTDRPTGSLLVEVQPFAVVNHEDVILLDTGLGFSGGGGKAQLEENLAKHNIHPEDVTKILLSHLHKDHAGGIDLELFPNAIFFIYEKEMEFAQKKGFPSYYVEDLSPLLTSDRVVWLQGESGKISDKIRYEHTDGHSPEHIVFWIETDEGIIFYGGDEAPQLKQMKIKYVAKYDFDGKKAMLLRMKWAEQGLKENWRFLFYHDVQKAISTIN